MDRDSHKRRLERFSRNERIFPGGEHETRNCTGCARIIADRFGGEVRGYYHAHNPTARVGESEGGRDFAITPDRFFLVDPCWPGFARSRLSTPIPIARSKHGRGDTPIIEGSGNDSDDRASGRTSGGAASEGGG
jgi:hypothetical protein